jgi:6-aminohexanoate-oligomer endohydrolase
MSLQTWSVPRCRRAALMGAALSTMLVARIGTAQDPAQPVARVYKEGPSLRFDFPEMRVGVAEYDEGPTGTTVFYFPDGVKGAVDVRGGSPGTVNATVLMDSYESKLLQAVVFSGGSWYGLSAATGVANGIKELKAEGGNVDFISGVVGAIIYDVGGRRYSRITPDDRLGKTALRSAAAGSFPLGARGAGRFAMQGVYYVRGQSADKFADWPHSGQGGAFRTIGPTKIGVFTVVNALGTIVDRSGRVVRCKRNRPETECSTISDKLKRFPPVGGSIASTSGGGGGGGGATGNTTLTLVVTNQKMPFWALQRLARQVHGSMNRAIQPFATEDDGDVLYAVTTDQVENKSLSFMDLSVIASELAWDAVLSSVPQLPAESTPVGTQPTNDQLARYFGTYELYGGNELAVSVERGFLNASLKKGNGRIYFDKDRKYRLVPAANGLFIVESPARDVIRFEESGGRVTGLILNPGPWAITAKVRR